MSIVDGKERRKKIDRAKSLLSEDRKKFSHMRCSNKPGTVSRGAVRAINSALKQPLPVRIFVQGEEDMLALPLFIMVPERSVVIYGQPIRGMVIVKINDDIRQKARDLIHKIRELS